MPRRCSYYDGRGRQCRDAGTGNPPLCVRHEDMLDDETDDSPIMDAVVGRVMEHPRVGGVLDSFGGLLDRAGGFIDRLATGNPDMDAEAVEAAKEAARRAAQAIKDAAARARAKQNGHGNGHHQRPPNGHAHQQRRPPPPPPKPKGEDPRVVLGFSPGAPLTKDLIKKRQRELAKIFHSDKGGSDEAMKRVNVAVDELLKQVRA